MKFSEAQLKQFASPISETEDQQCKNAIGMVRDALKQLGFTDDGKNISKMFLESSAYQLQMRNSAGRDIKIFIQGSYANGTNIRAESDVDIAVIQEDIFRTRYRDGVTDVNYSFVTIPPQPKSLKDEVEEALIAKFGRREVERHNKSIHVKGNSYRKDADSVPSMRYRNYSNDYTNDPNNYVPGVFIRADDGAIVINYPEQHIENGVQKNKKTDYIFKKMVRIAKTIRSMMEDESCKSAKNISSFVIESLLWNVPDAVYLQYSHIYRYTFDEAIQFLSKNKDRFHSFHEINGIKPLGLDDAKRVDNCRAFIDDVCTFFKYDVTEK